MFSRINDGTSRGRARARVGPFFFGLTASLCLAAEWLSLDAGESAHENSYHLSIYLANIKVTNAVYHCHLGCRMIDCNHWNWTNPDAVGCGHWYWKLTVPPGPDRSWSCLGC